MARAISSEVKGNFYRPDLESGVPRASPASPATLPPCAPPAAAAAPHAPPPAVSGRSGREGMGGGGGGRGTDPGTPERSLSGRRARDSAKDPPRARAASSRASASPPLRAAALAKWSLIYAAQKRDAKKVA